MWRATLILLLAVFNVTMAAAAQKQLAEMTEVVRDVEWVSGSETEKLAPGTGLLAPGVVRTNRDSRAEFKLRDGATARLGGDTAVKIAKHVLDLQDGLLLVQSPEQGIRLDVHASGIAGAVHGSTALIEYRPPMFKFLVLQGTARLFRPGHWGDSLLINAGQMVFGETNGALNDPVDFKLDRFLRTCRLLNELGPLPNNNVLVAAAFEQNQKHRDSKLVETNLVIFGEGTSVTITKEGNANSAAAEGDATPPPSAKSGASTVLSPTQTTMDARRP